MLNKIKTAFDNLILLILDKYPVITLWLLFAILFLFAIYDFHANKSGKNYNDKFKPIRHCKIDAVIPNEFIQVTSINPENGKMNITLTFDPGLLCYICDNGETYCR